MPGSSPSEDDADPKARRLGEGALQFGRWYLSDRFSLMQGFLGELTCDPGERRVEEIERRFLKATRHAKRVLLARSFVTFLLTLGLVATAASAWMGRLPVSDALASHAAPSLQLLDTVAAIAGSASLLLLVLRLSFDRYLALVETSATFLAIQLSACR